MNYQKKLAAALLLTLSMAAHAQDKVTLLEDKAISMSTQSTATPNYLTSLKENAQVKIGGLVRMRYSWISTNAARGTFDQGGYAGQQSRFHSSSWEPWACWLDFEITPSAGNEDLSLKIRVDIDDSWDAVYQQDEYIEEAYFTAKNLLGSGLGVKVGKQEIPFGYDKDVLLVSSYMHSMADSYLQGTRNGLNSWTEDNFFGIAGSGNGQFRWDPARPMEYDNRFAIAPFYKVNESLLLEAAIYQDSLENGRANSGRHTNDPGLSFAARATWNPIEDLKVSMSGVAVRNRGMDNERDIPYFYASSIALDYTLELCGRNVNMFAEWEHGWQPSFTQDLYTDDIFAGFSVGLTDALTLLAQYEWLHGRTHSAIGVRQLVQRAVVAMQYKFDNGLMWETGFQREWGYVKSANPAVVHPVFNGKNSAYANMIYSGLSFAF